MTRWTQLNKDLEEVKDANESLGEKVLIDIQEKKDLREALEELKKEIEMKEKAILNLENEMRQLELKIEQHDSKDNATKETQTEIADASEDPGIETEVTEQVEEVISVEPKTEGKRSNLDKRGEFCFWNDQGICKYGRLCSYKHAELNCELSQECQNDLCCKRHPKLCLNQDYCWFGNNCAFLHSHQMSGRRKAMKLRHQVRKEEVQFDNFSSDELENTFETEEENSSREEYDEPSDESVCESSSCCSDRS